MMSRAELLAQAIEAGFTEAQFKALTATQRIAFLHAAAVAKAAGLAQGGQETQRVYRKRLIVGGAAPLPGETP